MIYFLKRTPSWLLIFSLALSLLPATRVEATTEFQKEFVKLYAKGKDVDKTFKKLVRKAKCYACHQGKDDHKNCNIYGKALSEYLSEDDKKDKKKIVAALKKVADQSSNPSQADSSPTFGELIAKGELPGGSIADSKIEPPKAEGEAGEESLAKKTEESTNNQAEEDVPGS